MREHGVLERILRIYREAIRCIGAGEQFPAPQVHTAAGSIRSFIENHHERLEEQYVFPPLIKASQLTGTVAPLRGTHPHRPHPPDHRHEAVVLPSRVIETGSGAHQQIIQRLVAVRTADRVG